MIKRLLSPYLLKTSRQMPIIGIVGPRQSGKTTLAQQTFSKYKYVNLEQPDVRRFATEDPVAFLSQYNKHAIFDEIQRVPELFSYIQVKVDQDKINGQFVLTGSQHFLMMKSISQTLAGRIGLFKLYPLSYEELSKSGLQKEKLIDQIWYGGYPRIYDQKISPSFWLNNYIQTYLDRDVGLLSQVTNLSAFEKFLQVIAGRTGQLLNLSSLGSELGTSHNTIKSWVTLLETSGIIFFLNPYFGNITKRLVKTKKLYFVDTGLVCQLLGIQSQDQLISHPLYGSISETFVVSEYLKSQLNRGLTPNMYFWRDKNGLEADLLLDTGDVFRLYEIKASQTIPEDAFVKLETIKNIIKKDSSLNVIYGGNGNLTRTNGKIISWKSVSNLL